MKANRYRARVHELTYSASLPVCPDKHTIGKEAAFSVANPTYIILHAR